jgi:hypothetical protein
MHANACCAHDHAGSAMHPLTMAMWIENRADVYIYIYIYIYIQIYTIVQCQHV